jgi:threonine aldolase
VIGRGGLFTGADVEAAYKIDNGHYAPTRLVAIENTHNRGGGRVFPQNMIVEVAATARRLGVALHLDGARLWNAHIATGVALSTLAAPFDTVSVCLSKGLGAPVGSVLTGPRALMERARRRRKMLGGGMRQAGVLAAAGRYALAHHIARLADDHASCRAYAEGIVHLAGVRLDLASVETNLCIFELTSEVPIDAAAFVTKAKAHGLLVNAVGPRKVRVVTHLDVDRAACIEAAKITREVLTS